MRINTKLNSTSDTVVNNSHSSKTYSLKNSKKSHEAVRRSSESIVSLSLEKFSPHDIQSEANAPLSESWEVIRPNRREANYDVVAEARRERRLTEEKEIKRDLAIKAFQELTKERARQKVGSVNSDNKKDKKKKTPFEQALRKARHDYAVFRRKILL